MNARRLRRENGQATRNLVMFISDVLDFSKIEAGALQLEKAPFHVSQLLANVQAIMGNLAEQKGLLFSIHRPPDMPDEFIGDPYRAEQGVLEPHQ
jgi:signal transduction histidine kinase